MVICGLNAELRQYITSAADPQTLHATWCKRKPEQSSAGNGIGTRLGRLVLALCSRSYNPTTFHYVPVNISR